MAKKNAAQMELRVREPGSGSRNQRENEASTSLLDTDPTPQKTVHNTRGLMPMP